MAKRQLIHFCDSIMLQNIPLKIKWPNDVYYGRKCKLGGSVVNATTIDNKVVCVIGKCLMFLSWFELSRISLTLTMFSYYFAIERDYIVWNASCIYMTLSSN